MKNHVKIYLNHFGYDTTDVILCEVCNDVAVDIHHIEARGMGGDPKGKNDVIENLQALCRSCHDRFGDRKKYVSLLLSCHQTKLNEYSK
jgi:5-methylcytosine-specific restriction endonuclease McrA